MLGAYTIGLIPFVITLCFMYASILIQISFANNTTIRVEDYEDFVTKSL